MLNFFKNFWSKTIKEEISAKNLRSFFEMTKPILSGHSLIRIGGNHDGGYLIPDDLNGVRYCFSPGVSNVADFESDLAKRKIKSYMCDYSVQNPPSENPLFGFEKKYLGNTENEIYTTLPSWINRKCPNDQEMILQMDIEGFEYPVLMSTDSNLLKKFRIIVIEFHDLHKLLKRSGFTKINEVFKKILVNFEIVHIHPNNCLPPVVLSQWQIPPVMEFTFLRKDRVLSKTPATVFPHPLDNCNVPSLSDYKLPDCWYK